MEIIDAKLLLPKFNSDQPQLWADLGCGNGTFTYALAEKLAAESNIIAVDRNTQKLKEIHHQVQIDFLKADFENIDLPMTNVDGILLANALHFVKDKIKLIQKLERHFAKGSKRWMIVEYDHSVLNQWEPYPIPFSELKLMFEKLSYSRIEKTGERKSVFGGNMYAALITTT